MKNSERTLNIMFQKSGSGSITSRLALPKDWINTMGLNPNNRQVLASFDENTKTITIKVAELS